MVGRNDPCPCGSGKKYKKCCLGKDDFIESDIPSEVVPPIFIDDELARWKKAEEILISKGMKYVDESGYDIDKLIRKFYGESPEGMLRSPRLAEGLQIMFLTWLWIDYKKTYRSKTLAEKMELELSLGSKEKRILSSINGSHFSAYQVVNVDKGVGVEMENIIEGGRIFLHDYSMSMSAVKWTLNFCHVYSAGPYHFANGISFAYPAEWKQYIKEKLHSEYMKYQKKHPGALWHEFSKAKSDIFGRLVVELNSLMMKRPDVKNTDGDDLVFCNAVFKAENISEVVDALLKRDDISEDEDQFVWFKEGEMFERTTIGSISFNDDEVILECNSRERIEKGKEILCGITGVKFVSVEEKNLEDVMREYKHSDAEALSVDDPGVREVLEKANEEHYRKWVDIALPALNGMTPREAVKIPEGRGMVIDLIRGMEMRDKQSSGKYQVGYDWNKLRRRLKLPEE